MVDSIYHVKILSEVPIFSFNFVCIKISFICKMKSYYLVALNKGYKAPLYFPSISPLFSHSWK